MLYMYECNCNRKVKFKAIILDETSRFLRWKRPNCADEKGFILSR
jgi:hypothetical protein